MASIEVIREKLQALRPTHLEIIDESNKHANHFAVIPGNVSHLKIIITSKLFTGKSLMEKHRMIYKTLGEELKNQLHALSIETR